MITNTFFEKLVSKLNLGNLIAPPSRVSGGLTHKMYKIQTEKSRYAIKLLNPNIMKRTNALINCKRADSFEELLKGKNINAIYSIIFNNQKIQLLDDQYFYVYYWYEGQALNDQKISKYNCEQIGKVLADIHNITLKEEHCTLNIKSINWRYYIDLAKEKKSPIYDMLNDKINILKYSMKKGNEVINKLPNFIAVCHNDLDCKNVLWHNNEFKIIDLECLDYYNPYLELFKSALSWSGYESCNIDFELFKTFIDSYFKNSNLNRSIDWDILYYANNGQLDWLEYNIKRALMLATDSNEEKQLGINEGKKTIDHIVYYDSIKDELLNNCR